MNKKEAIRAMLNGKSVSVYHPDYKNQKFYFKDNKFYSDDAHTGLKNIITDINYCNQYDNFKWYEVLEPDFSNISEIFKALLEGEKIRHENWPSTEYVNLINGNLNNPAGREIYELSFNSPEKWRIYKPVEKPSILFKLNDDNIKDIAKAIEKNACVLCPAECVENTPSAGAPLSMLLKYLSKLEVTDA